jgi:predicted glycosyltransferase
MPTPPSSPRPPLLFYCQHSVGLGHLVRSLALAGGLAAHFQVVMLSGGPLPTHLQIPPGVRLIALPPLGHDADYALVSRDPHWTVQQAMRERTRLIQATFDALAPRVVMVELFPFGRKKFAFELLPLLERAHSAPHRPLVLCSLRDILVTRRPDQPQHDQRACQLANHYLDAILVHADPRFARLEESFHPSTPLAVPVHYTGFVTHTMTRHTPPPHQRPQRVLVSAGGGLIGEPLLRAAVAAQPTLLECEGLTTTVAAGPFLPDPAWQWLTQTARHQPGLQVHRYLPDLAGQMATSRLSISQCGYNTAMDILASRTPAVVVPFADGREDEQSTRARRLQHLGVLHVLDSHRLDPSSLVAAARQALRSHPQRLDLDFDGRANSTRLVAALAGVPDAASTR